MALSNKPWSQFSQASYSDANAYARASLVDLNPAGQTKVKSKIHLPVREPDGDLNRNGVHAAAARLAGAGGGVKIPPAAKKAAARKLVSLYANQLHETAPDSIARLARS